MKRGDVALIVIAVLASMGCVRLGIWQLDRLATRRARNAELVAARARPPQEVAAGLSVDSARDRRLRARGVFDYDRETVWPARTFEGVPGVHLLTPLRLADGSAVLVDRGWVPSPDALHIDREFYREPDSAMVVGVGRATPRGRGDVDPTVFAYVLQQDSPPGAARGFIRRIPPPPLDDGPHLGYAIQWFSFAVVALVGTWILVVKGRNPPRTTI
jgi:surfeit locus 1 family protein